MEDWAKDSIIRHNALMRAAHLIVLEANQHCSNTQSERLETQLEEYEVLPNGNMICTHRRR